jgi:acetyl-CoA acetyltransferase
VIVEAVRTPIGRGHAAKGAFRDVHPNALLGAVYEAVIERAGIDASIVGDVVAGAVSQVGEQSNNIARNAWLQAGLPVSTPGTTIDHNRRRRSRDHAHRSDPSNADLARAQRHDDR